MKKLLAFVLMAVMATSVLAGCTEKGTDFGTQQNNAGGTQTKENGLSGKITTSGSTSMEDLVNAFGSAFTKANPGVSVEVQAGGSSVGISNAKDGVTDIGNSSRALKPEEKKFGLTEHIVAIDGIAVVVNPANKIEGLTKDQVAKIFKGEIKNWKELGGSDAPIVVVGREAGSGTRDGFEELLKIKDKAKYTVEANETGIVKTKVKEEKNAIGYMSLGKVDTSVKAIKVDSVVPSESTVKDKSYILQRPFVMLTKGEPNELVKAFLGYINGADGQALVQKDGYVPAN